MSEREKGGKRGGVCVKKIDCLSASDRVSTSTRTWVHAHVCANSEKNSYLQCEKIVVGDDEGLQGIEHEHRWGNDCEQVPVKIGDFELPQTRDGLV